LVHVHTVKGKGYQYAEKYPGKFHGIGPFDPESGMLKKSGGTSFSDVFGDALTECAAEDPRVCAITAAMAEGTGLGGFAKTYPDRFFDVAIAEGHGVAMAAGLASQGMLPVFAVYSTFLQRGYDQLIHDVALEQHHVVLGVDRAGLVGADGETHHGCFDATYLSAIPGFTVLCPANFAELRSMVRQALFETKGPVAVRYPRGGEGHFCEDSSTQPIVRLREGADVTLVGYGIQINHLLEAADSLAEEGIQAEVVKLNRISPLVHDEVCAALGGRKILLVLEDAFGVGCVGQRLAAILAEHEQSPKQMILKNLEKTFAPAGSVAELEHSFGLDADGVAKAIREAVKDGK
jgi:1-deoxy-D-xylulose-5-phosphate synthase